MLELEASVTSHIGTGVMMRQHDSIEPQISTARVSDEGPLLRKTASSSMTEKKAIGSKMLDDLSSHFRVNETTASRAQEIFDAATDSRKPEECNPERMAVAAFSIATAMAKARRSSEHRKILRGANDVKGLDYTKVRRSDIEEYAGIPRGHRSSITEEIEKTLRFSSIPKVDRRSVWHQLLRGRKFIQEMELVPRINARKLDAIDELFDAVKEKYALDQNDRAAAIQLYLDNKDLIKRGGELQVTAACLLFLACNQNGTPITQEDMNKETKATSLASFKRRLHFVSRVTGVRIISYPATHFVNEVMRRNGLENQELEANTMLLLNRAEAAGVLNSRPMANAAAAIIVVGQEMGIIKNTDKKDIASSINLGTVTINEYIKRLQNLPIQTS